MNDLWFIIKSTSLKSFNKSSGSQMKLQIGRQDFLCQILYLPPKLCRSLTETLYHSYHKTYLRQLNDTLQCPRFVQTLLFHV